MVTQEPWRVPPETPPWAVYGLLLALAQAGLAAGFWCLTRALKRP